MLSKDDEFWNTMEIDSLGNEGIVAKSTMTGNHYAQQTNTQEFLKNNLKENLSLEFTLSLRKDEKEYLYRNYIKILKAIDSIYPIYEHKGYFEKGSSGHRHIHAKIVLHPIEKEGYKAGLIEELSRLICLILRRQWQPKCMFYRQCNYRSVPFVLQFDDRKIWDEYMSKDSKLINHYRLCKKYKIYFKI